MASFSGCKTPEDLNLQQHRFANPKPRTCEAQFIIPIDKPTSMLRNHTAENSDTYVTQTVVCKELLVRHLSRFLFFYSFSLTCSLRYFFLCIICFRLIYLFPFSVYHCVSPIPHSCMLDTQSIAVSRSPKRDKASPFIA